MARCGNCNSKLSCSCQKVTAKDGKKVCKNCVAEYNKSLETKKARSTSTSPSAVKATYSGPGVQLGDL